jgi:hypothetical protein
MTQAIPFLLPALYSSTQCESIVEVNVAALLIAIFEMTTPRIITFFLLEGNSIFSPSRLTIPTVPVYPSFNNKLLIISISSGEDPYDTACVLVPALGHPPPLPGAALAPVLALSYSLPFKRRAHTPHGPPSPQATHSS